MRTSILLSLLLAACGPSTSTCVPGMVIECPCAGGATGSQTCLASGSYGACECDGNDAGTDAPVIADAPTGTDTPATVDAPVETDAPVEMDVPAHVYYAGRIDGAGPVWGALPSAGGMTGLDAGDAACATIGADHVCDYEEVVLAASLGQLSTIPAGTTAWVQRTTTVDVGGVSSPPGPGGNCVDWTYSTNHIGDGEYAVFETAGVPTFHLDNDTIFDPSAPGVHDIVGDLQCGGTIRSILCCFAAP